MCNGDPPTLSQDSAKASRDERQPKRLLKYLLLTIILFPVLVIVSIVGFIAFEFWSQVSLGPSIEKRYGFEIGTPYVIVNNQDVEVLAVLSVTPGGAFDKAGINADEIIVSHTIGGLYRDLNENAGVLTTIEIVQGGGGLPISQRAIHNVQVAAP